MLDTHQNHPRRAVPVQRQFQRHLFDKLSNERVNLAAIVAQLRHARPAVVTVIKVVPTHFIHADCQHGFNFVINALLNQPRGHQLINVESGGMPEIENQRVAQGYGLVEVGTLVAQTVEKTLIQRPSLLEIVEDLLSFFL